MVDDKEEAIRDVAIAIAAGVLLGLAAASLGCVAPKPPQTGPSIPAMTQAVATEECTALYKEELRRDPDRGGLASCVEALVVYNRTVPQQRAVLRASEEWLALHTLPTAPVLHADGRIFRTSNGTPWRWKGVSAFKLLDRFAHGEDISDFLEAYLSIDRDPARRYNVLRVWPYVEGAAWRKPGGKTDWPTPPPADLMKSFFRRVGKDGWTVEFTLLTDDKPARIRWAKDLLPQLIADPRPSNVLIEVGNEPQTGKDIPTAEFGPALAVSRFEHASGDYEDPDRVYGTYLVHHSGRSTDWPRRAHDCMEWWSGAGPSRPGPQQRKPCVLDEPLKVGDKPTRAADWMAYGGVAGQMAAGATFHSETGKYGFVPTADEKAMAKAMLDGLNAFPADTPGGPYRRIVEAGQPSDARTYVVGKTMVRVQQTGTNAPENGWTPIDTLGVLWRK